MDFKAAASALRPGASTPSSLLSRIFMIHSTGNSITTAWASIPSPRPTKPSFSVVVALILTQSVEIPKSAAIRICILCNVRRQLGSLSEDCQVTIAHGIAFAPDQCSNLTQQAATVRLMIGGVGIGKMLADVAQCQRTQQGVTQSMQGDITIGMSNQAVVMGDTDAPQGNVIAFAETMDINAMTHAGICLHAV